MASRQVAVLDIDLLDVVGTADVFLAHLGNYVIKGHVSISGTFGGGTFWGRKRLLIPCGISRSPQNIDQSQDWLRTFEGLLNLEDAAC